MVNATSKLGEQKASPSTYMTYTKADDDAKQSVARAKELNFMVIVTRGLLMLVVTDAKNCEVIWTLLLLRCCVIKQSVCRIVQLCPM